MLTPSTTAISLYRTPSARKCRHCRCCDVSRQTAETMRANCSFLRTTSSGLSLASILHRRTLATSSTSLERSLLRSEEHTSELQSHLNLVCRLLLEKKKTTRYLRILSLD